MFNFDRDHCEINADLLEKSSDKKYVREFYLRFSTRGIYANEMNRHLTLNEFKTVEQQLNHDIDLKMMTINTILNSNDASLIKRCIDSSPLDMYHLFLKCSLYSLNDYAVQYLIEKWPFETLELARYFHEAYSSLLLYYNTDINSFTGNISFEILKWIVIGSKYTKMITNLFLKNLKRKNSRLHKLDLSGLPVSNKLQTKLIYRFANDVNYVTKRDGKSGTMDEDWSSDSDSDDQQTRKFFGYMRGGSSSSSSSSGSDNETDNDDEDDEENDGQECAKRDLSDSTECLNETASPRWSSSASSSSLSSPSSIASSSSDASSNHCHRLTSCLRLKKRKLSRTAKAKREKRIKYAEKRATYVHQLNVRFDLGELNGYVLYKFLKSVYDLNAKPQLERHLALALNVNRLNLTVKGKHDFLISKNFDQYAKKLNGLSLFVHTEIDEMKYSMTLIGKFTNITELNLSGFSMHSEYSFMLDHDMIKSDLKSAFKGFNNLKRLRINSIKFKNSLESFLQHLRTPLEYLNISSCGLNDADLAYLANSMHATCLNNLVLRDNELAAHIRSLGLLLSKCAKQMEILDLGCNSFTYDMCMQLLDEIVRMPKLKMLVTLDVLTFENYVKMADKLNACKSFVSWRINFSSDYYSQSVRIRNKSKFRKFKTQYVKSIENRFARNVKITINDPDINYILNEIF